MTLVIRATAPEERRRANDTFRTALLYGPGADEEWSRDWVQDSWDGCHSLSAWDGDRCIGHAASFHFHTAVPGGEVLPTAGVSRVGVLPTYTRRGVLTALMTQLLEDARHQGKVLASLRASEAVIYGRFGFGVAGHCASVEIGTDAQTQYLHHHGGGSIRLLERHEVLSVVPSLADRLVRQRPGHVRPGVLVRPGWMHVRLLGAATTGSEAAHVAVHSDASGNDDGWVAYTLSWREEFGANPRGTCEVTDLWGASPDVEMALWRHVLDLDLVDHVRAEERPVDDVVRYAMTDPRALRFIGVHDEQWLRLIDVGVALRARTYASSAATVTIAVSDPLFDTNNGVWRVSAGGVDRIEMDVRDADLIADVSAISAVYMGGTPWWTCVSRGEVVEHTTGAVMAADELFAHRPQPFCGSFF